MTDCNVADTQTHTGTFIVNHKLLCSLITYLKPIGDRQCTQYKRHTEARWQNHFCRGKESALHIGSVSVDLGIQHAMGMRLIMLSSCLTTIFIHMIS
jgi:hypothetical protein